jgi:hypothetical protein
MGSGGGLTAYVLHSSVRTEENHINSLKTVGFLPFQARSYVRNVNEKHYLRVTASITGCHTKFIRIILAGQGVY